MLAAAGKGQHPQWLMIDAIPDGEIFVVVAAHRERAIEALQNGTGIVKIGDRKELGAQDVEDRNGKQGRANAMARDIEQVEGERFGVEPVIAKAVAAEVRARQIAPVGLDRPSERFGEQAANVAAASPNSPSRRCRVCSKVTSMFCNFSRASLSSLMSSTVPS